MVPLTNEAIIAVGKAILPYLPSEISTEALGALSYDAAAALVRTLSEPDRKSISTIGQEVSGLPEQDGNATNEQLLAKLDMATHKRSLVIDADDALWAPAHDAVCDARAAVLARMSALAPSQQDAAGTMVEVERLADVLIAEAAGLKRSEDAASFGPNDLAIYKDLTWRLWDSRDALLSAFRAIVADRDNWKSEYESLFESRDDRVAKLVTRAETAEAERDESKRRHAVTTIEAGNLASDVGRLRAELAALRAEREVPGELVALANAPGLESVEAFRFAAARWARTLITTPQGARTDG